MKNTSKIAFLAGIALFSSLALLPHDVEAQVSITPAYTVIDISGTPNVNDFPFGICADDTYRYMTLHSQGALVKILKKDNTYAIYDNNAVASGEDWYSCVVANGKIFVNERDTGLTRVFDPVTNTYTASIPIPQNIAGGAVSYTEGYTTAPHKISIAGVGTHVFGFGSFGELKFTNGFVWQAVDYVYDFPPTEEAHGAVDVSFHGIARINPTDNTVTRYAIPGASALRGLSVDVTDSTILWVTDVGANKLYRFNTDTGLVTDTILLPVDTNPWGVANDLTAVYIAENNSGGVGVTSKILKVLKSDFTPLQIDTGASVPSGKSGTFSVYVANGLLIWTDQANHVGTILISDISQKTLATTTGTTDSNHFGNVEGTNFVFAGKGSVVQGSIQLTSPSTARGGSGCGGDCYAPHFGVDQNNKEFFDDGLIVNGLKIKMDNVLHVHNNETITAHVGTPVNFTLKIRDTNPEQIRLCEIGLGIPKGHFVLNDATTFLTMRIDFQGNVTKNISGDNSAIKKVEMYHDIVGRDVICSFTFTPTKHLQHDMFAVQAIDQFGYNKVTFVNEGFTAIGKSLVGTPIFQAFDDKGRFATLAILDPTLTNLKEAIDTQGNLWHEVDGHWKKDFIMPDMTGSLSDWFGYDRNDYFEFNALKKEQERLARQYFDSSMIQSQVKPFIPMQDYPDYPRTHDPLPNMLKAQMEFRINQANNS